MADTVDLRNHIDCSQGKAFLDGEECLDAVSFSIVFTPVTSSTKTLGHTGEDTRWKGHTIKVSLSERSRIIWKTRLRRASRFRVFVLMNSRTTTKSTAVRQLQSRDACRQAISQYFRTM